MSEWSKKSVKSVVNLLSGNAFQSEHFTSNIKDMPLIRIRDLNNSQTDTFYAGVYDEKYVVNNGDVLVGMDGDFHVCKWQGGKALLNQRVLKISEKKGKSKEDFIFQLLKWQMPIVNQSIPSTTVKHLSTKDLDKLILPIPEVAEQQKIASILSSVDRVIDLTEQEINKLKDLKKGMMQELLTKGIGHTKFKDSPVGRIPESWELLKVSDLVKSVKSGVSVNGENRTMNSGECGVLKISSVTSGVFLPLEHKTILPHEVERAKISPRVGTILFSRANTSPLVGASAYIDRDFKDLFLPDKLWEISPKAEVNGYWLFSILWKWKEDGVMGSVATGTSASMQNISKPKLLNMNIAVPPSDEQNTIGRSLASLSKLSGHKVDKLLRLKNLKAGLMQDLLTGKVRVKV